MNNHSRHIQAGGWILATLVFCLVLFQPGTAAGQVTGSGTIRKIPKWTGETSPSSALSDSAITESSTGNIGIGTTTPNYLLEVRQTGVFPGISILNGAAQRATIGFGVNAGASTGWAMGQDAFFNGTKDFYLYDVSNSAYRFYVSTSGKVGIGTLRLRPNFT